MPERDPLEKKPIEEPADERRRRFAREAAAWDAAFAATQQHAPATEPSEPPDPDIVVMRADRAEKTTARPPEVSCASAESPSGSGSAIAPLAAAGSRHR